MTIFLLFVSLALGLAALFFAAMFGASEALDDTRLPVRTALVLLLLALAVARLA